MAALCRLSHAESSLDVLRVQRVFVRVRVSTEYYARRTPSLQVTDLTTRSPTPGVTASRPPIREFATATTQMGMGARQTARKQVSPNVRINSESQEFELHHTVEDMLL